MAMVGKRKRMWRRGTTTVEAAIVFPLLFLVTMGAIRYGWLFLKAQQITNAARMGARIAIRAGSTPTDVTNAVSALMTASGMGGADYEWHWDPNGVPWTDLELGDAITIYVTVPCADIDVMHVPLFTDLEPANWRLGAQVTMAKEGF